MTSKAWQLLLAEESKNERVIERVIYENKDKDKEKKEPKEVINSSVTTVKRKERIVDFYGSGEVRELTLILNRSNVRIILGINNKVVLNKTVDELLRMSKYVSWITAADYGDRYLFSIKDVTYSGEFKVEVDPSEETEIEIFYVARLTSSSP